MEHLRFTLDAAHRGRRLDRFLEEALDGLTRSRIKRLIQEGHVTLEGAPVKAGYAVKGGETLEVHIPDPPVVAPEPEAIPLKVVYEDEALLVIDKPPGLSVHPGAGRARGTLVNALLGRGTPLSAVGAPFRPGIVHRLDKNTSGLLVVAKTDAAHLHLSRALARREVQRTYWAMVWGTPPVAEGDIEAPVGRNVADRRRMQVVERGGRRALTHYRVVWSGAIVGVLHLKLHTGRTHQIRVHLKHLGYPVFGDPDYGGRGRRSRDVRAREALRLLDRQALHAMRLAFAHPVSGQPLSFVSRPGPDICGAARELQVPSPVCDPGFLEES